MFAGSAPVTDIEAAYYADLFGNTRGGITTNDALRYQGLLELGLTVHLGRIREGLPGTIHLLGLTTHGEGLTERIVGDTLVLSDIDSFRNTTQVGEYWWELPLWEDRVTVRLGKQDVNTEFIYVDAAKHFVQSSFELTPNSTLPTFPQPSMAAVTLLQLQPDLQLKLGAWNALARPGDWGFSGYDAVFLASELEYKYADAAGRPLGTIAFAAGYQSPVVFEDAPLDAVHGYAVQWEQWLFREADPRRTEPQGLIAFAAYYPRFFEGERLEESIGTSGIAGLVYTGLLPHRDRDVLGLGFSGAKLFQGGTGRELVYELFYRAELTPRVSLQPDLQYLSSPSGIHPDALVVGLRLQMDL
jgi:porin